MTAVISLVNYKGGSGKTTCTACLAQALHERGRSVIVVDTDPQGSALAWQGQAGWPVPVIGLPSATVHRQLWGVVDTNRFDAVVVDTPPLEDRDGIVESVLRVSTTVLVPMAPTMMELDRLAHVWKAIDANADGLRYAAVLLNRVVPNASSTQIIRAAIEGQGRRVLDAQVGRLERYAQAFGFAVPTADELFGRVADELITGGAV